MESKDKEVPDPCLAAETHDIKHDYLTLEGVPEQICLAQVPIMNTDHEERVQLEALREDMQMPPILEATELFSINLLMNNA